MLKQLTYRQRNYLLLGGTVLFLILAYVLSIGRTVGLYHDNARLTGELQRAEQAPRQIALLERENKRLEQSFGADSLADVRQYLLVHIGQACNDNNALLKRFEEPETYQKEGINVQTHKVELQGKYHDLVKAVYQLERLITFGKIVSLHFEMRLDRNTRTEDLVAVLFIQNILQDE